MTSPAKIAANQRNARKSTGPRSPAGRMRSRQNAFRHGLATPISVDIAFAGQIDQLTNELAGKALQPGQRQAARMAALAELELARAQHVKVQMINRAAQDLQKENCCEPEALAVSAYARQLKALVRLARYERRALSQRKRALRALTAAQRASDGHNRNVNLFLEPVAKFDVTAVIAAALAHSPEAQYSALAGWSGESYGTTLDFHSDGIVRADTFIQCHDAARGLMRIHLIFEGNETIAQTFAIAKRSAGIASGRWIAICPTTQQAVADLYVRAGGREVASRHALNLHYRSKQRHHPDTVSPDHHANGSAAAQHFSSEEKSSGDSSVPVDPTGPNNIHRPNDVDVAPPPIKPVDASSVAIDIRDLKAGNAFAAAGKLDEALAAYQRYRATCQELVEHGNIRAAKQLYNVWRRIDDLAFNYLLISNFERALKCADDALAQYPNSMIFNITRAHALMFLGRRTEAQAIYLRYLGKKMAWGHSCDGFILNAFDDLREAGLSHPLMDDIEKRRFEPDEADEQSAETAGSLVAIVEPTAPQDQSPVAVARPIDIELGDQLLGKGQLEEARASYHRARAIYNARIAADGTDSKAQFDLDLAVRRIGCLAFEFLLTRDVARALESIEGAMSYRPKWMSLYKIHAYALMLCGRITEARNVHRKNCGLTLEGGEVWGASIGADFEMLRTAGFKLPIMDDFERQFASKK